MSVGVIGFRVCERCLRSQGCQPSIRHWMGEKTRDDIYLNDISELFTIT